MSVYPVGVLFSRSGGYSRPAEQGYFGALAAVADINANDAYPFKLEAHHADPKGNADRYAELCRDLIRTTGAQHIVGCTTSWSRKEVIPVVEKLDALLWYPCVYEGFEVSENLIYVAACANQHLVPLLDHIVPRFGARAFLTGSNYIWGWETNRIARDILTRSGGAVLGERYVPIGDEDIDHLIEEIREKRPDFILNNLIGTSSYAFLAAYRALGMEDPAFRAENCPVVSCNLCENETTRLGADAAGHYTVSSYFRALASEENDRFAARMKASEPSRVADAFFVQAYAAVVMIAEAIRRTGSDAAQDVLEAVRAQETATPLGPVRVDRGTNHVNLCAHIGRARADGDFDIVHYCRETIAPDPFLTATPLDRLYATMAADARQLRVVR
ncbi:transporter substrate-binding domain-containing protein [Nitratireductor sp. GZWM139]|uniref:transporter substrate-binding domain-containing protein n=1 Tax=Nitratireductor sp. GZWM139 TaxID=2950541 RepID=UPI0024BEBD5F|nr:transporter substrate-binding domain-containing protein [Nitratireductor sp. GZWM139]MDJ1463592.1 transporter substrate-binding domain-containing protein [Nitratireductor sp. GZWM139]